MKEYITTAIINLTAGLIGLTIKQASRRVGFLAVVKGEKNLFEIIKPVQFKAGEIILIDPDKITLASLELTPAGLALEAAQKEDAIQAEVKKRLEQQKATKKPIAKKPAGK